MNNKTEILKTISGEYKKLGGELLQNRKFLKATKLGYFAGSKIDDLYFVFDEIKLEKYKNFIDLGSGDGRAVLIASLYTNAEGIEIDKELAQTAEKMQKEIGKKYPRIIQNSAFVQGNYLINADFSKYDIIFINPDNYFYELEKKLRKEMRQDALLVVYNPIFKPLNLKLKRKIGYGVSQALVYTV